MTALPFVTADLPGCGGQVKASPEDFRVDELPAYLPAGTGAHLWLRVEKRDRTTREVIRDLAHALGVADRDVGYAGLKDRAAVTTQWLSFPVARDPDARSLDGPAHRVLEVSRHANKLRTGHLRGNRFAIRVRGGDLARAQACAAALRTRGFANFFGPQRFGADGRNAEIGRSLLLGHRDPETSRAARDRFLRRLVLSAWQARVFNAWLEERLRDGLFASALAGDVLARLDSGGLFVCTDPVVDSPRVARFECSPAGPMFGHKMRAAEGDGRAREERLLAAEGVATADLARGRGETEGTRRACRLPIELALDPEPDGFQVRFELPRGSYATVVVGELVKGGSVELEDGGA